MAKERKKRTNLYVPHSLKPKLKYLTAEEKGIFFEALLDYSICGEIAGFEDRYMQALFEEYAGIEKQNAEAYEETCRRNRENGQNGGRPSEEPTEIQSNPKEPKVTDNNPSEPKKPDKDKDRDKDLKEKDPKGSKKKSGSPLSPTPDLSEIESEPLRAKTAEWLKYKAERREKYQETGLKSFIAQVKNNADRYGAESVCEVISDSMSSGYKGVMWDRLKRINSPPQYGKSNAKPGFEQRPFDEQAEKERRVREMMKAAEELNALKKTEGSG